MNKVIINDFNIPDECINCPLAIMGYLDSERHCYITGRRVDSAFYSRMDDCPLVEVED